MHKQLLFAGAVVLGTLISCNGDKEYKEFVQNETQNLNTQVLSTDVKLLPSVIKDSDESTTFTYDDNNRIVSIEKKEGIGEKEVTTITYNANNQVEKVSTTSKDFFEKEQGDYIFKYEGNQITLLKFKKETGDAPEKKIQTLTIENNRLISSVENGLKTKNYTYDEKGNLASITKNGKLENQYSYDQANGIFKATNTPQWLMIVLGISKYNLVNNAISEIDDDGDSDTYVYSDYKEGYPQQVKDNGDKDRDADKITYIPAK